FIARLFAWLMKYSPLESPNHTPSITQSHRKREAPLRRNSSCALVELTHVPRATPTRGREKMACLLSWFTLFVGGALRMLTHNTNKGGGYKLLARLLP
ncbi:MAG: hypothetical protein ACKO13_12640, partial [Cytophagales bacterium]